LGSERVGEVYVVVAVGVVDGADVGDCDGGGVRGLGVERAGSAFETVDVRLGVAELGVLGGAFGVG
jgi:hypothetical protein